MFYFNTPDQINGDIAYNNEDYITALDHYDRALETLNRFAASNQTSTKQFYDAYTHVLMDVITTTCLILDSLPENLNERWAALPGLIQAMQNTWVIIKDSRERESTQQKINEVYLRVAQTCEFLSDKIVDELDDNGALKTSQQERELLRSAARWMERAIEYNHLSTKPVKLSTHLGYLYLLERQFKNTQSERLLLQIHEHLENNHLLEKEWKPINRLEVLSYALRVGSIAYAAQIKDMILECKHIIRGLSEEELELSLISEINEYINRHSAPKRKRVEKEPTRLVAQRSNLAASSSRMATDSDANELAELASSTSTASTKPPPFTIIEPQTAPSLPPMPAFFQPQPVAATALPAAIPVNKVWAFQQAIDSVISITAVNPKFLANLSSIIADYFRDYKNVPIPSQNSIIIAANYYQQALSFDPAHVRAKQVYENLHKHHKIINYFLRYNQTFFFDYTKTNSERFSQSIQDLFLELESYIPNDEDRLNGIAQGLFDLLTTTLEKNNLMGHRTRELINNMRSIFDETAPSIMHTI